MASSASDCRRSYLLQRNAGLSMMNAGRILTGTIFILLGILLFLNNAGVLPWDIWLRLFMLWPVLLIAFGFRVVFSRGPLAMVSALIVIAAVLFAIWCPQYFDIPEAVWSTDVVRQPLQSGITNAAFTSKLAASDIVVRSLEDYTGQASGDLCIVEYSHNASRGPSLRYAVEGNTAAVDLQPAGMGSSVRFQWPFFRQIGMGSRVIVWLSPVVEWDIQLDIGASKLVADFVDLPVRSVGVKAGVSNIVIQFGSRVKQALASFESGLASVKVIVPHELGVSVAFDSALSSSNLDEMKFIRKDDLYLSPGFSIAEKTLGIDFDSGVSKFEIEWAR
jgi:hypothetical protein